MPPYKSRTPSNEILILNSLNKRMNLKTSDKQRLYSLTKGYEGELMFDKLTERVGNHGIILNDLKFKVSNTTIQIDSAIIFQKTVRFYEVKNHEGDHFFKEDKYYRCDGTEKSNPLHQMRREETFFRQLLKDIDCTLAIDPFVLFINPEFTMYNAPFDQPIIYPTQLNRHINHLNNLPSMLTPYHWSLADKLIFLQNHNSDFTELPKYNYGQLRKGPTCGKCKSFDLSLIGKKGVCKICGHEEKIEFIVMRGVWELRLLFPELPITTALVQDWCKIISKKWVKGVLEKS